MAEIRGGDLVFSTGRRIEGRFIYRGFIGINESLELGGGCDNLLAFDGEGDQPPLTPVERRELGGYMRRLWTMFATGMPAAPPVTRPDSFKVIPDPSSDGEGEAFLEVPFGLLSEGAIFRRAPETRSPLFHKILETTREQFWREPSWLAGDFSPEFTINYHGGNALTGGFLDGSAPVYIRQARAATDLLKESEVPREL